MDAESFGNCFSFFDKCVQQMPEIAELPAPADPAGGVSCASDGEDKSTAIENARAGHTLRIGVTPKKNNRSMVPRVPSTEAGAARGIRTPDPVITNDVLYQLSYCGGPCGKNACHLISGAGRIGKENADPGAGHSAFERSGYRFA